MFEFFQQYLLNFENMMLWIAVNTIILVVAAELIQSLPETRFRIDNRRLKMAALIMSSFFLGMIVWYAYQTWTIIQP